MNSKIYYNIIGQAKRAFSSSDIVKEKYKSVRIEKVRITPKGNVSKVPDVYFPCNICGNHFKREETQCDHIEPVVPVQVSGKFMSWDVLFEERLCVEDLNQLQILCKPCHGVKSSEENKARREWRKKPKYIVYMTTNKINKKRYIGVHKCIDLEDGYLGSGTALRHAVKMYGRENFYRKVLYVFDSSKEAYEKEAELVTLDKVEDKSFYNLKPGGFGATIGKPPLQTKKVRAINIETGNTIAFNSFKEASKALNIAYSLISKIVNKKDNRTKCKGWTFEEIEK